MKTLRVVIALLLLGAASSAIAASRAFVSGNGVDTGTCPITAPCRSFAYAITQIASGGEIIAMDTAGYGSVTIAQAATIIAAPGVTAFASAGSGFVITVAAGASDTVTLHGITVSGNGTTDGVTFNSGKVLNIESCIINQHSVGVVFERAADGSAAQLQMLHCILRNNTIALEVSNAPFVAGGRPRLRSEAQVSTQLIYVAAKDCAFISNPGTALEAHDNASVSVTDSIFAANTNIGVSAVGSDNAPSLVALDRCTFSGNGTAVLAGDLSGSGMLHGTVLLANCMITQNFDGIASTPNGQVRTRTSNNTVTNTIYGNTNDGSPTSTYPAQ